MATSYVETLSLGNVILNDPDAENIQEVRFVSKAEMNGLTVCPEILKDNFWDDLKQGFPPVSYSGVHWGA